MSLSRLAVLSAMSSLLIAEVALFLFDLDGLQADMLAGWTAAYISHLAGFRLFRKSVGKETAPFLLFAAGGIILRVFLLIIFFSLVLMIGSWRVEPVLVGLFSAYFIGVFLEIWWFTSRPDMPGGSDPPERI